MSEVVIQVQRPWLTIPALSLKLFLYTLARFSIPNVSFLTDVVRAIRVFTVCIHITRMASIVTFIDILKSYNAKADDHDDGDD